MIKTVDAHTNGLWTAVALCFLSSIPSRLPFLARLRGLVILVFTEVSSMNTSRRGSRRIAGR